MRPGAPPVFLAVGRLIPLKGYDDLLKAFRRLTRELGTDARLVLLGDGPDRGRLQSLALALGVAEAVHFAGYEPNPYAWMSKTAALVLSSRYEGSPSVLAEALACGANVVSTDCPSGPSEILEGGRWGRLVPVGDQAALARAMYETLRDPLPRESLRDAAERFSVARSVSAWQDLLLGPRRVKTTGKEDHKR